MQHVSDIRSNENDQLVYAAKKLGNSPIKKSVFKAVYFGKRKIKTAEEIANLTKLPRKTVLDAAKKLVTAKLIHQTKHNGDTAYTKDDDYQGLWHRVLKKAGNKSEIDKIPTKVNPKGSGGGAIILKIPKQKVEIEQITIDHVSSFEKVGRKKSDPSVAKIPEKKFKIGLMKILDEKGKPPSDWGGEKNDLFTNKLKIGGKRFHAAFALKGPGKKSKKLTQKDMGKNGDQIQRLLRSSAQVLFVQYWREIDQGVLDLMSDLAIAKSYSEGRTIYFGIINGEDSSRLILAYPKAFK